MGSERPPPPSAGPKVVSPETLHADERVADAVVQGVVRWVELPGEKPEPLKAVDRSGEASRGRSGGGRAQPCGIAPRFGQDAGKEARRSGTEETESGGMTL